MQAAARELAFALSCIGYYNADVMAEKIQDHGYVYSSHMCSDGSVNAVIEARWHKLQFSDRKDIISAFGRRHAGSIS